MAVIFTCLFICQVAVAVASGRVTETIHQPEFGSSMGNLTVAKGRDASFTCVVRNLGSHRVAWIKADDKGILAMHDRVLTNNARLSVLHSDLHTWTLHIRDVRRSDRGAYMCQINTEPMKYQKAFLEVVIPPDILSDEGGGEVLVPEGGSARLVCKARGFPLPKVTWRREDGQDLVIKHNGASPKVKALQYEGEVLVLNRITRSEMGAYLCIAANGVPPSVSRRIVVNVHFHPIIQVPTQLVGAPLGTNITLECSVEASPKPINYWERDTGEIIIASDKYRMEEIDINSYTSRLKLHLRLSSLADEGTYKCASKNSIGDSSGNIRVYATTKTVAEARTPEPPQSSWMESEDADEENVFDRETDDDVKWPKTRSQNTRLIFDPVAVTKDSRSPSVIGWNTPVAEKSNVAKAERSSATSSYSCSSSSNSWLLFSLVFYSSVCVYYNLIRFFIV